MPGTVEIYGASDDLIEVEGAIREEYGASSGANYVYLSTGDILRFRFEAEGWRANIVHLATSPRIEMKQNRWGEDEEHVFVDGVSWLIVTDAEPQFVRKAVSGA